jgi:hypothetical protein
VSCQQQSQDAIVGKWKAGPQVVEIMPDGTIIHTDRVTQKSSRGRYEFIGNDTIQVTLEDSQARKLKVTISNLGDKLTLTQPDGTVFATYRRAR